jgi:nudix motif 8
MFPQGQDTVSDPPIPERFDDAYLQALRERLSALTRRRLRGPARQAAVVVPLCHVDGAPSVLFTRRTEKVGTHKGQVSFPGGMADDDDEHLRHTALRELDEELGVQPASVDVLGLFHDAQAITGVHVTPVIGFLGDVRLDELRPSPVEIDDVFTLTLAQLVAPELRYQQDHQRGRMHVFDAGPYPVWGLTAYILAGVLTDLLGLPLPDTDVRPFEVPG